MRDTPTPCGGHQQWPTWTTRVRCRGIGERWVCPTTMHPLCVGGSVSQSLAGMVVDEIVEIGRWKTERVAAYNIRVDNLYTVQRLKTGP